MKSLQLITLLAGSVCLAALTGHGQIHTAPGFEAPNPSASYGSQLSGINQVYGSYDGAKVGFAAWEKFSEPMFSGLGSQYWAGGAGLRATLSQRNEDAWVSDAGTSNTGLINVDGTDYYGRLTKGGYDFSIDAIASGIIQSVTLQIKHSPYMIQVGMGWERTIPFAAELTVGGTTLAADGVAGADLPNFSDTLNLNTFTAIYTYRWDNLNIPADQLFSIGFFSDADMSGEGYSVDTIALHVQQVPEPALVASLLAVAALVGTGLRRRR